MKKGFWGKDRIASINILKSYAYETEHESEHEWEHEGIHQVSHRGRMLCHRHLPHQLVYRGTRDREEPAAAAGEQYLDKGRLEPLRAYYHHTIVSLELELKVYRVLTI